MAVVVGREAELAGIASLLDGVSHGPALLMLAGDAGIGKTTVWSAGVEAAESRGFEVLLTRPAAGDAYLSYAGLADLLRTVPATRLDRLPRPQRQALDAALLRGSYADPAPEPRAVAAGFLSVVDGLAEVRPLLIAIDDSQWLDEPSLQVVQFAARRCRGPVAMLATRREGTTSDAPGPDLRPRDPDRAQTLRLGPIDPPVLRRLIRQHCNRPLSNLAISRIVAASGGNPFFALELARTVDDAVQETIRLPVSLQAAVRERLGRLERPVREVLEFVAMLAAPRVELVDRTREGGEALALLHAAEALGVIELAPAGSIRFTHPLLAAGIASEMSPVRRREVHRRLSSVVEEPEERARHLAMAAIGPEPEAVSALDNAAEHARRRGAPSAAAELLELAIKLGADDGSRHVRAAIDLFDAGDPVRARQLLEATIPLLGRGTPRAEALGRLGMIRFETDADPEASQMIEQAVEEADPAAMGPRSSLRVDLAYVYFVGGRIPESLSQIATAIKEAELANDPGLLAEALAGRVIIRFLSGAGTDDASLARALQLEVPDRRTSVRRWPSTIAAQVYRWTHRLDEAHAAFVALRQRCIERGAESDLWFVSLGAIPAACWSGDIEAARELVNDAIDRAQIVESGHALGMARLFETQYLAWIGDVEKAREAGAEAENLLGIGGVSTIALEVPAALGAAELSLGDYEAAAHYLAPAAAAALAMGFAEPAAAQFLPDAAETSVARGRSDEAEPIIALLETSGRSPDRAWARAMGHRCRGILLATQGRQDEAVETYRLALLTHDQLPQLPYDRARTLLVYAASQRRINRRSVARSALTEAASLFDAAGAARWAERARAELGRLGLQPGAGENLTPTEERVAELAASGLTNREVAAALFVSPKTIDVHLSRIYRKLGVRSRAELGWRMAQRSLNS